MRVLGAKPYPKFEIPAQVPFKGHMRRERRADQASAESVSRRRGNDRLLPTAQRSRIGRNRCRHSGEVSLPDCKSQFAGGQAHIYRKADGLDLGGVRGVD